MSDNVITVEPQGQPLASVRSGMSGARGVCPPGMEHLINTSQIYVKQLVEVLEIFTGIDTCNRYEILDAAGRRMYFAAEQSNCCERLCCGSKRRFRVLILDSTGGIVLKINRGYACCCYCCSEVKVSTGTDVAVGRVRENCWLCSPTFTVWDADNVKALKITGPCTGCMCCTVNFKVRDMEGNNIGLIQKKWGGIVQEAFTTADTFGVSFPVELDPRLKTLLLGAVLLIDFMFFEEKQNPNILDI